MRTLQDYLTVDKRGKKIYQIGEDVSQNEKYKLIEEFIGMHSKSQNWSVKMHMTKRSMPFVIYSTVTFSTKRHIVNKMIVQFNTSIISRNSEEVELVWKAVELVKSL